MLQAISFEIPPERYAAAYEGEKSKASSTDMSACNDIHINKLIQFIFVSIFIVLATFVHSLHPTKEMPISKITFKKDKDGLYLHHEQECRDELNALFKLWGITVDHAMAKYMLHQWLKQILSKDMYRPMSNVKKDEDKPEHIIKHNRRHLLEEMLPWVIETEWGITEGLLMDCYKDQLLFHLDGNMKDLAKTFFQLVNAIWGSPQPKTRKPQLSPLRI